MVGLALARMRLRIGLIAAIRTIVGFRFVIEAQAFGGVDMHYDRVVNVFDLVQYFHQRVNVITLLHIAVVQAECLEQIQFGHAIRRTQLGKLPVHTAEILSDRHFVVVDDDDEITALFGRIVQPLERNGRTQGSIADNGDNIADSAFAGGAALHIAGFGKTAGQRNRSAGMAEHKGIMFAFQRIRETGHLIKTRLVQVCFGAAGKHFVHVALVRHVENETVAGRVEHAVQCHSELHHAKIRADMPAMFFAVVEQRGADFEA